MFVQYPLEGADNSGCHTLILSFCRAIYAYISLCNLAYALGRNIADGGKDHPIGGMRTRTEAVYSLRVDALEAARSAEDVVPQLRARKDKVLVLVVDGIHRRVAIGIYLVEDNLSLLVEFVVGEGRVKDHIGQQLYRLGEVTT